MKDYVQLIDACLRAGHTHVNKTNHFIILTAATFMHSNDTGSWPEQPGKRLHVNILSQQ